MNQLSRRKFVKVCAAYVAALASWRPLTSSATTERSSYNRVRLMRRGRPIRPEDFEPGQVYIFNYPYVTTPCMIFNLGEHLSQQQQLITEEGDRYTWPGGSGPDHAVVAYSAICAHKMTYPAKSASFLNYRHSKVVYFDSERNRQTREKIIYCCSERSVYDPARGAQVIGGPAPQPLATILLDYDSQDDSFYATGTIGGEMFRKFLSEFEFRLQLDFKIVDVRQSTVEQVDLLTIEEYSEVVVHC